MTQEEIRRLSSILFGNAWRLEVAAAIGHLEGKPISVKAVAEESGIDSNRVQEQVAHFKGAGALSLELDPNSRRKDYRAIDTSYWRSAARLLEELQDRDSWS